MGTLLCLKRFFPENGDAAPGVGRRIARALPKESEVGGLALSLGLSHRGEINHLHGPPQAGNGGSEEAVFIISPPRPFGLLADKILIEMCTKGTAVTAEFPKFMRS